MAKRERIRASNLKGENRKPRKEPLEAVDKEVLENFADDTIEDFSYREHRVLVSNPNDCTLVHQANTNTPSLVNVGQLHDTHNPTDQGRWTICFVPARGDEYYIYWDEALEIYKDYIIGDDYGN